VGEAKVRRVPRQCDEDRRWAAVVHCRELLGYTVTEANEHLFTAEEIAAWEACIEEFVDAHG
jgi:hypothetical protein